MTLLDALVVCLSLAGSAFFIAGTVGLLRFPDTFTRLHALTKADNLGLGLIVLALLLQSSLLGAAKLILIWLLALLTASNACLLLGRWAMRNEKREEP
jgi:multicomponent Na+:H+ antiporter subunit G